MRSLWLPFTTYLTVLDTTLPAQSNLQLVSLACGLASLVVMAYHYGAWRQEMVNIKHNVGEEVTRSRRESAEHFARLEERFAAVERFIAQSTEHRVALERWQARVDATLDLIRSTLARLEGSEATVGSQITPP
jgi:hypothetical protein